MSKSEIDEIAMRFLFKVHREATCSQIAKALEQARDEKNKGFRLRLKGLVSKDLWSILRVGGKHDLSVPATAALLLARRKMAK